MQQVCREIESSKSTAFVSSKSLWFSDMARRCFRASISFLSNTTWPIGTVGIFFKCLIVWENCSISHQLPIITRKAGPLKNQKTIQNLTSIFNFLPGSIPPTSFLLGKPRLTLRSPLPSDSIGQTGFKCPFSGNAMTGTTEFNSSLKVTRGRFVFTLEGGSKSMTSKNVEWHKKNPSRWKMTKLIWKSYQISTGCVSDKFGDFPQQITLIFSEKNGGIWSF